ncbi:hypothetical protein [Thalassotalea fusca]
MKSHTVIFVLLTAFSAHAVATQQAAHQQPILEDYKVGEKWIWKYRGVTSKGEIRAKGTDTKEIVSVDGALHLKSGDHSILLTDVIAPNQSTTPRYHWPLKVGKKWTYEQHWQSQDGTDGKTSQVAQVLSFKQEKVAAGNFMAYTIRYKGKITNSRGYSADTEEIYWYAPAIKNFIKLTQIQDDYKYVEELIEYSIPET